MKIEEYVMSPEEVELEEVDLEGLAEWEKETILKVLQRNNRLKFRDERRVQQLAVRIQLQRMTNQRSPQDESLIKTRTGEWHKELMKKRCQGKPADVPGRLYRRISIELISNEARKIFKPDQSPSSSSTSGLSTRSSSSGRLSQDSQSEMDALEEWDDNELDDEISSSFKSTEKSGEKMLEKLGGGGDMTKSISQQLERTQIKQREI